MRATSPHSVQPPVTWAFSHRLDASSWLNVNKAWQRQCSESTSLMYITQAADAPPFNTDGALPPFTLSCCSQSDESAFYLYFTLATRLCPFLRQPCSPASHLIVFLPFSSLFSLVFRLFFCHFSVHRRLRNRYFPINQPFA